MAHFEDARINEALDILNAVAKDKKAELQAAMQHKYADLSSVVAAFSGQVKTQAAETYQAGKQKVEAAAGDIDQSVHRNPYAYIGGAALVGLLFGLLVSRSRKD